MIVVDASVAVKWFLPEHGDAAAADLLTGSEQLAAPSLIRVEVTAAITRRARLGQIGVEEAAAAAALWFQALEDGVMALYPDADDLPTATRIALEIGHPLQDCLYLALAARLEGSLITADRKFVERVNRFSPAVVFLGNGGTFL